MKWASWKPLTILFSAFRRQPGSACPPFLRASQQETSELERADGHTQIIDVVDTRSTGCCSSLGGTFFGRRAGDAANSGVYLCEV